MPSDNIPLEFKPIDIRALFQEKDPALARLLPGFVFRLIHKIMRLDFINSFIIRFGDLTGMDFINAIIKDFEVEEEVLGEKNIPERGSFIFAGNHPLGGFDSMLLMKNVSLRLGEFKFLANDVMMNVPPLKPLVVPVNHHGSNSRETVKLLQKTYLSGQQILIFPSGLASRRVKGKVVDLEWQKHFISKSIEYKRDIIPVFISGNNSNRFYSLAKWRTFLGVNWNLEMFLLPDETYHHRKKKIQLYFGAPIPYNTFDKSRSHMEWAAWVKDRVYELPSLTQTDRGEEKF